jgi:DNA (cytosine-5)-methyltransferase 1
MVNQLSLFTGYGGFSLGLRLAGLQTRTVMYVEWERYPQEIIKARIKDGYLDDAPIWGDISTLDGQQFRGMVDIITAGFPCQPHSVAGLKRGADDERNLWPETLRIIREVGSRYVILENVPGLLSASSDGGTPAYGGTVVGELASLGYSVHWRTIGADDVGAPHRRKRWWCIAVANTSPTGTWDKPGASGRGAGSQDVRQGDGTLGPVWPDTTGADAAMANAQQWGMDEATARGANITKRGGIPNGELAESESREPWKPQGGDRGEGTQRRSPELADCKSEGLEGVKPWTATKVQFGLRSGAIPTWPPGPSDADGWAGLLAERPDLAPALGKEAESQFRGMDDGRSHRVDELKALGNGLIPAVAAEAWHRMMEITT